MKKCLIALLATSLCFSANAQDSYKKAPQLVINIGFADFLTNSRIKSSSISTVIANKQWARVPQMELTGGLSFLTGLSDHLDLNASLNGTFVDYPYRDRARKNNKNLLLTSDAVVNLKLLTDKYTVVPYLSGGVGVSLSKNIFGAYMPIGTGLQFRLADEAFILLNAQYRIPVTETTTSNFYYGLGIASRLGNGTPKTEVLKPLPPAPVAVIETPKPADADMDGVSDDVDACPNVKGIAAMKGCPDSDADGIADKDDACPNTKGSAALNGCPDSDGDGIADRSDRCPNQAGPSSNNGCPITDKDNDGVNDNVDNCPNEAGPASNAGCPIREAEKEPVAVKEEIKEQVMQDVQKEVNKAAGNIYFQTGSAALLFNSATTAAIANITKILKNNPNYKLDINGHTDNVGNAAANTLLSKNRANAVLTELVKKGIAAKRLTANGFGSAKAIATNATPAGRAKNRRVEMKIRNF